MQVKPTTRLLRLLRAGHDLIRGPGGWRVVLGAGFERVDTAAVREALAAGWVAPAPGGTMVPGARCPVPSGTTAPDKGRSGPVPLGTGHRAPGTIVWVLTKAGRAELEEPCADSTS